MPLKKHHKIMIGSFTSLILISLIINSALVYILFIKFGLTQSQLKTETIELNSKISEISLNLLEKDVEINQLKKTTSEDFSNIVDKSIESVVAIRTDVSQGTGFIISPDGYIVTNAHILNGGREIYSITSMHQAIPTQLIGYDLKLDIALLKISGNYSSIEIEDSNNIEIGEKVIAIGNPLGLQFSVSEGIVSATDRTGPTQTPMYVQTDAALNPGNSGGPLINKNGKVIGINNFKIGGGESLGFALESNYMKKSINTISTKIINQTLV